MSQDMISVDEARRRTIELASQARFRMPVEKVDLFAAVGRVAAADLTSDIDVSPFDNTAMDGFAVVSSKARVRRFPSNSRSLTGLARAS